MSGNGEIGHYDVGERTRTRKHSASSHRVLSAKSARLSESARGVFFSVRQTPMRRHIAPHGISGIGVSGSGHSDIKDLDEPDAAGHFASGRCRCIGVPTSVTRRLPLLLSTPCLLRKKTYVKTTVPRSRRAPISPPQKKQTRSFPGQPGEQISFRHCPGSDYLVSRITHVRKTGVRCRKEEGL